MGISVDNFFQLKFEESQFFIDHYQGLLDLSKFNIQSEMTVAKNIILQSGNEINYNTIKQNISKSVFPNLYKLLQVAITIPISSATCERSFSAMRKVKTWLRTSMLQEKFNNSSILHWIPKSFISYLKHRIKLLETGMIKTPIVGSLT
ncbi:uncharacterized protein LOC111039389 [Myzus persicae]|uniref:uncharacterized protein LOC111039389 n=1 Tax=Myzus persicae TaxID=13164 RepID=UPI000B9352D5|nr:uncharacterized protein LOC111039389 [Myzus persicae]